MQGGTNFYDKHVVFDYVKLAYQSTGTLNAKEKVNEAFLSFESFASYCAISPKVGDHAEYGGQLPKFGSAILMQGSVG